MAGRDYEAELEAVMNAIAESVSDLTDDEIVEEARAEGGDPIQRAEETRTVLLDAVKNFKERRLEDAKAAHEERASEILGRVTGLPGTPEGRRELLDLVLRRKPELRAAVTAQYRGLEEVSDEDVVRFLRDLHELGALDEFGEDDE